MGTVGAWVWLAVAVASARPTLSGPEQTVASGRFVVHYTTEGVDAPSGGDHDHDGIPDEIPRVVAGGVDGLAAYSADGWREVLADDEPESDAIDVYVRDIDKNGYTHSVDVGAWPAASCYIEIDAGIGSFGGAIVEDVTAHEVHHCVEYAYTVQADAWIYEATATWEQYRLYEDDDGLALAANALWAERLAHPERPLDDTGDRFEYAGFIWLKFWTEYGGVDRTRAPALWEALAAADGDWRVAHEAEAQRLWGMSFDEAYLAHAVWNGFACADDDGQHYDPSEEACLVDGGVPVEAMSGDAFEAVHTAVPDTAQYVDVDAADDPRPIEVTCDPPGTGARIGLALVARAADGTAGEARTAVFADGEGGTLRLDDALDPGGSVRAVHASLGEVPAAGTCAVARVEAVVEPEGCGCAVSRPGPGWLAIALGAVVRRRRTPVLVSAPPAAGRLA